MRELCWVKGLQAVLVASLLVANGSAAGGEPRREQMTLSVQAQPREQDTQLPLAPPGEEDIPPEWLEEEQVETEREDTPRDEEDGARALLSSQEALFPVQVDAQRPELLWVPAYASREELASRLFGDAEAAGALDFEPRVPPAGSVEGLQVCVRVRHPSALMPELLAAMRRALDAQLEADVAWSRSMLSAASRDRAGAAAFVERGLRWSQRSDLLDGAGQSYFERYLQALGPWDEPRRWQWLAEAAEPLHKAMALHSKRFKPSDSAAEGSPVLSPGSVVGRFYFPDGASVQVRTLLLLIEETTLERAELRVRNQPRGGPRVLIPGKDGRWRGYSAEFNTVAGAAEPLEHPEGNVYWYYPGTLLIRPGDWRTGLGPGTGGLADLRRELLQKALAMATAQAPQPLFALDHDVLCLLTPEERLGVFTTVLTGPALTSDLREDAVQLLGRVLQSTPEREFPPLERRLTSGGVLEKLLGSNAPENKVLLGQAFTQKALASFPLVLPSLEALPTFHLGREGDTTDMLNVSSGGVDTTVVAPGAWDPRQGVGLGAEPALPGEAAGPVRRMALYFKPVQQQFQARYLSSVEEGVRSRALHPLEWVRVEVHGPKASTQLMTAMELALIASVPDTAPVWAAVGRISEMHMVYGAVSAWTQAPGVAGVVAGSAVPSGMLVAARRAAMWGLVKQLSLVAGLAVVDTYRDELSGTPEGRAFLAVHDLAMVALAGRDISKLATSGIWRELVQRGGLALRASGARASSGLRESVESLQAVVKTLERMLAEGKAVATPEGLRFTLPGGAEAFKQTYFAIRGEMAAARALGGIRSAGLAAQEAEKTLGELKLLAAENPEMGRAYNAVARRAAAFPADEARAYLTAVESLHASARGHAKPVLGLLLRRSGAPSLADPLAFLKEAEWLVSHPELEAEAVAELARKACREGVNLGGLRSSGLTTEDLNAMGRDKMMPWKDIQQAAAEPGNLKLQRRVRQQLRGIAAELLTERNARTLFPGFRLTGRQVKMKDGHIIDNVLTAMMESRLEHGVEIKSWNENRWRTALDAWLARQHSTRINDQQEALVKQLQHLIEQLADAANAPRGNPFLVVTDRLSGPTRLKLTDFLRLNARGTQVIEVEEYQILEKTRHLRAALKLPEDLSGGAP